MWTSENLSNIYNTAGKMQTLREFKKRKRQTHLKIKNQKIDASEEGPNPYGTRNKNSDSETSEKREAKTKK